MTCYVGIDIAKASFDVFINGTARRFANCSSGFRALLKHLPSDAYCVMEATGNYGFTLAELLVNAGISVALVNPVQIKRYAQMRLRRHKTDAADAELITLYAENQQLGPQHQWQPPSEQLNDLRQQQTVLEQLKKQQTALQNQLEENQLEALSRLPRPSRQAQAALKKVLAGITKAIKELEAAQQQSVQASAEPLYQLIVSVPGIGPRAAVALLILTDGFSHHRSARQLASYIGVCPRPYQSGTSIHGSGSIGFSSTPAVRSILYMCAVTAMRYNHACRCLYQRLLGSGKAKKLALIAVAHKLLRQVVAVVEQGTPFVEKVPENA